ncbi:cysteine hydrolase family protein [Chitinimonas koreensis]|uniref:cysteine hydrolase family protein n=1 Tax=Chitinimonas koreensis TaxID=356302 RepID=UPI0003F8D2CD|nr:cysteine hydrolase family protein [Chitinimonas koreensis]QNM96794.1 cysteine hydrolase [Chitinimonas koreensis]
MQAIPSGRIALLVVDMQVGLYHGPEQPYQGPRVLAKVQQLIARARAAGAPIFAARHIGPEGSPIAAGSPFWQLLPGLGLDPATDTVFDKTRPSCFLGTDLAARLAAAGVGELVVAGMKTQYCIDTTCRVAAELGFRPILPADAHTCMDTPALPAQAIVAHHNATLNGPFARVVETAAVQF